MPTVTVPLGQKLPAAHVAHASAAAAAPGGASARTNVPAGQPRQLSTLSPPSSALHVPGGQSIGASAPLGQYVPGEHLMLWQSP